MGMSQLGVEIAAGADRLRKMLGALASTDRRIEQLRSEKERAGREDQFVIGTALRELQAERSAGNALIEEAERQFAQRESEYRQAVDDACSNLHSIGGQVDAAARRADRLLREAAAAIDDLVKLTEPMARTVLPRDARHYFGWPAIMAAIRSAFGDQMPGSQRGMDAIPIEMTARLMMRAAGENASRIRAERKNEEMIHG